MNYVQAIPASLDYAYDTLYYAQVVLCTLAFIIIVSAQSEFYSSACGVQGVWCSTEL